MKPVCIVFLVVVVALASTTSSVVTAAALDLNFPLFQLLNTNRTASFGGDSDTASADRMNPLFRYTMVALVGMENFTVDKLKQRVLSILPAQWRFTPAERAQFDRNFMALEYCTWPEHKPSCDSMKTNAYRSAWRNFIATRFTNPVCRDDRVYSINNYYNDKDNSLWGGMYPFNPKAEKGYANWTLVRFTFAGADRATYFDALIWDDMKWQMAQLGVCDLGVEIGSGSAASEGYTVHVDAANPMDSGVVVRGTALPSNVQSAWDQVRRLANNEPANSAALVAIIVLLIVFVLAFCLYKCLVARSMIRKIQQQNEAGAAGGNNNRSQQQPGGPAAAYAVTDDLGRVVRGGGVASTGISSRAGNDGNDDDLRRGGVAAGGVSSPSGGGVRRKAAQDDDEAGNAVDEMAARIRRMAAKRKEKEDLAAENVGVREGGEGIKGASGAALYSPNAPVLAPPAEQGSSAAAGASYY